MKEKINNIIYEFYDDEAVKYTIKHIKTKQKFILYFMLEILVYIIKNDVKFFEENYTTVQKYITQLKKVCEKYYNNKLTRFTTLTEINKHNNNFLHEYEVWSVWK